MHITISCHQVPAVTTMEDADDFTAFDVVIDRPEHVWVTREELVALAGHRGQDAQWCERLDAMIGYATSKGWVDAEGRIRAHVTSDEA